jgi:hypothetical protein
MSAAVWLNLESNYRLALAQQAETRKLESLEPAASSRTINRPVRLGFIPKPWNKLQVLREWLSFSASGTPEVWTTNWDRLVELLRDSSLLISTPAFEGFCRNRITKDEILRFASEQIVSAGVIVSRLQSRGIIRQSKSTT